MACDNDSANDGVRSLARFDAIANQDYFIAIDAAGGARGVIEIHWRMGEQAVVVTPRSTAVSQAGTPLLLRVGVSTSSDPPFLQWRFEDRWIDGATNQQYSLPVLKLANAGVYSVVLSNLFGVTTNVAASVTVFPPKLQISPRLANGSLRVSLLDATAEWHALEKATNLSYWSEVRRFYPTNRLTEFEIPMEEDRGEFYRVVPAK